MLLFVATLIAGPLYAAQALAPAAEVRVSEYPDPYDAEIVVIAKRMTEVEMTLGRNANGKIFCAATKSSGMPAIDELICRDSAACLKLREATRAQIESCVAKRRPGLVKRITRQLKAMRDAR